MSLAFAAAFCNAVTPVAGVTAFFSISAFGQAGIARFVQFVAGELVPVSERAPGELLPKRVEARLLLVCQRVVELFEWRSHNFHRIEHRLHALLHRFHATDRCERHLLLGHAALTVCAALTEALPKSSSAAC
jgi:hypothetical protein